MTASICSSQNLFIPTCLEALDQSQFLESHLPQWFAHPPEKTSQSHEIPGDWATVHVLKMKPDGTYREFPHAYTMECSTGNLYGIKEPSRPKPWKISKKCVGIFLATPFYALCVAAGNLFQIAVDISSVAWKVLPQLVYSLKKKPVPACLANAAIEVIYEIPCKVLASVRRIVMAPLFAIGMLLSSALGILYPQEGRKWLGKIEYEWHDRVGHPADLRHGMNKEEWKACGLSDLFKASLQGKVCYLGYCMAKQGNIHDRIGKEPLYIYAYENENKDRE